MSQAVGSLGIVGSKRLYIVNRLRCFVFEESPFQGIQWDLTEERRLGNQVGEAHCNWILHVYNHFAIYGEEGQGV